MGDQSLLHQVIENFLANAFKFTKSRQPAIIEVGGRTEGKENIYYVKDNGAGFDERYITNLFRPFQRLHSGEEYEGTGVGLAIVKRIIQRHGGRVWAEGKVDGGRPFISLCPKKEIKFRQMVLRAPAEKVLLTAHCIRSFGSCLNASIFYPYMLVIGQPRRRFFGFRCLHASAGVSRRPQVIGGRGGK